MKLKNIPILSILFFISIGCKTVQPTTLGREELYSVGNLDGGYITTMGQVEKANKWNKVKISYFNRKDIITIYKPVLNDDNRYKYFEIDNTPYYLEWAEAPILIKDSIEADISCDLQKIAYDNNKVLSYGEPPMSALHRVSIVLLIDSTGKLNHYGFYQQSVYGVYERQALNILEQYALEKSFKPAMINGKPVGSVFRITGRILPNEQSEYQFGWLFQETPVEVKFPKYSCSNIK